MNLVSLAESYYIRILRWDLMIVCYLYSLGGKLKETETQKKKKDTELSK